MESQKKGIPKNKQKLPVIDVDTWIGKYIYLLIPILGIVYYIYSTFSDGFFGDDEIVYLSQMNKFFEDPGAIILNKPGYRLLFFLPSLLGPKFIQIAHILLTTFTVLCVYLLGKELKIKNSSIAALLFAFQPFVLQFSFRTWSEMVAAFFLVLTVLYFYRKKYWIAALLSMYLFTVRNEYALVSFILAIFFLIPVLKRIFGWKVKDVDNKRETSYKYLVIHDVIPFFILGLSPVILNIIGYLKYGDPFWLLSFVKHYTIDLVYGGRKDFWHYFRMYIFIVGPVTFTLLITGYLGFLFDISRIKEYFKKYIFLYLVFTICFLFQVVMAWDILQTSGNQGHTRLMLPLSPIAAIFAGIGLEQIIKGKKKPHIYIILIGVAFLTLIFLSYTSDKTNMLEKAEYFKFGIVATILLLTFLMLELRLNPKIYMLIILFFGVGFTIYDEKPLPLDSEKKGIVSMIEWLQKEGYADRPTLCNHIYFYYKQGIEYGKNPQYQNLNSQNVKSTPVGTICIFDGHYGYRPEFGADVYLYFFKNNPSFRHLKSIGRSGDKKGEVIMVAMIFEKIRDF
jgi:hypothetical protein